MLYSILVAFPRQGLFIMFIYLSSVSAAQKDTDSESQVHMQMISACVTSVLISCRLCGDVTKVTCFSYTHGSTKVASHQIRCVAKEWFVQTDKNKTEEMTGVPSYSIHSFKKKKDILNL